MDSNSDLFHFAFRPPPPPNRITQNHYKHIWSEPPPPKRAYIIIERSPVGHIDPQNLKNLSINKVSGGIKMVLGNAWEFRLAVCALGVLRTMARVVDELAHDR